MTKARANMASKQSSPILRWTSEMRMGLLAAVLITRSQWAYITTLWYNEFVDQIPGPVNVEGLTSRLRSQNAMIDLPQGQKSWSHIPKTLEGLAQEAPQMIARLQNAAASLGAARITVEVIAAPSNHSVPDEHDRLLSTLNADLRASWPSSPDPNLVPPADSLNTARYPLEPLFPASAVPTTSPAVVDAGGHTPAVTESRPSIPSSLPTKSAPHTPVSASSRPMSETSLPEGHRTQRMLAGFPRRDPGQPTSEYLAHRRSMVHGPYRAIPHDVLHPPLPTLLYRYYNTEDSHVGNYPNGRGFISGWYHNVRVHQGESAPLDGTVDFLWHCVEIHWNQRKFPTPFVSVTSNLHWVVTRAAEKSTSGKDMRISIINANAAAGENRTRSYHCAAFYDQLRERGAFDDLGKMMYRGKYEYLIWGHIPGSAIVGDFSYSDFAALSMSNPRVEGILKLRELEVPRQGGSDQIRKRWRSDPIDLLEEEMVPGLVDVLLWLYCNNSGTMIALEDAVTDLAHQLVFGWIIRPSHTPSGQDWMTLSQSFSQQLHDRLQLQKSESSLKHIAKSFLYGTISGLAEDGWSGGAPKRRASRHSGSRSRTRKGNGPETPARTPRKRWLSQYGFVPTDAYDAGDMSDTNVALGADDVIDIESPTVQRQRRSGAINWAQPDTPTTYSRFFGHDLDGMELDNSDQES